MSSTKPENAEGGAGPGGHRVLVFGPSGAGTSALGRALAGTLASQHFDVDDFYWRPSDPPFRTKRPVFERHRLMEAMFLPRRDWVLSGSVASWAGPIPSRLTFAIRLELDPMLRRERLEAREMQRLGFPEPGSAAHTEMRAFLAWADGYEAGLRPGRSLAQHKDWADNIACPVLVLDATPPTDELCDAALAAILTERRKDNAARKQAE